MCSRVLARMSFWACLQRISFTTKVVVNAERVTALCHQESFLIQVCNRLGPNTSKLTTGLSSPSRGILPELLMDCSKIRLSLLSSTSVFWL